jgi:hypothetical protein
MKAAKFLQTAILIALIASAASCKNFKNEIAY